MVKIKKIPVDKIKIPEIRASARYDEETKAFFEATIKKYGVLNPITVRELGDGTYELVAGKHRLEELVKKGHKEVDANVIKVNDKDALMLHLAENLARGKTDPVSEAKVIKKAIEAGYSPADIAKILGRTEEWVKLRLVILDLPEEYQRALEEGKLKVGHIREAARLPNPKEIDAALMTAIRLNWPVSVLRNYVENRLYQFAKAKQEGNLEQVQTPPTIEESKEIVRYKQCLACGQMELVENMRYPIICVNCWNLLKYCLDNLGDPKEAVNTIYEALKVYVDLKKAEEYQRKLELLKRAQQHPDTHGSTPQEAHED